MVEREKDSACLVICEMLLGLDLFECIDEEVTELDRLERTKALLDHSDYIERKSHWCHDYQRADNIDNIDEEKTLLHFQFLHRN